VYRPKEMFGYRARIEPGYITSSPELGLYRKVCAHMTTVSWPGNAREYARLQKAIARNCTCDPAPCGLRHRPCSAHALLQHQAALDHLVYVFRMRGLFVRREFYSTPVAAR